MKIQSLYAPHPDSDGSFGGQLAAIANHLADLGSNATAHCLLEVVQEQMGELPDHPELLKAVERIESYLDH